MSVCFTYSPRKFWANVCLIAGLACIIQASVHAQTLEAQPAFDVGDKWTFRYQNTGDRKEPYTYTNQAFKSEMGSGWLFGETQNPQSARKQYITRYDYKRGGGKENFEFKTNNQSHQGNRYSESMKKDDAIQFPLSVGKTYNIRWDYSNGKGYFEFKAEVEGFEKVKVEAGEFDVYRIKLDGWWYNTRDDQNHGRAQITYWFAPSAKQIVKSASQDQTGTGTVFNSSTMELVKWEPKVALPAILRIDAATPTTPAAQ